MGTIAARDCVRVLELTEQVAAAAMLAATQAIELRVRAGDIDREHITVGVQQSMAQSFELFDFLTEDRPLEGALRDSVAAIRAQQWQLFES